ncbi:MAG: 16S rRNA (adenine(1518)-N(6)/adenine(1519)-N(6))-dimethyltransferase RsmA [Chitinophagaceae bacterium]|nr:16S rRNA (adenine(1518)-N(6)/adenine(1519)-N(6))-dimethyltransferase RsmA [Chitinophagaceae bacterium]
MQYTLKKSLGQHFLHDENMCRKIVAALQERPVRQLVEVGPGGGAITKYLLQLSGVDLKVIEIDDEKVAYLRKTYPALDGRIIHQSVLDTPVPFDGPFTLIGNFPYNISTEIVFRVLDWKDQVECVIGMFQKEVAQRLAAKPGSKIYGVTSVLTQAFFEVQYLFDVPPGCFNPPPKVMSGVIRMLPVQQPVPMRSEKDFRVLVKAAFNQRRKQLRNAVRSLFTEAELQDPLFNQRAEQLSIADFAALTFRMK